MPPLTQVGPGQAGRAQIINGKTYSMYSPEWYDAQRASTVQAGTTLGKTTKAAYDAMGNPADTLSSSGGGSLSGLGSAAGLPPRVGAAGGSSSSYPAGSPSAPGGSSDIPQISLPDQSAAESATFGKAKDQVGQETAGALTGLRSALAARGMLGGQGEYRGTQGVVTKGQGELGDVSRQQAVTHLGNEMDIEKANQQAALTGRGQNIDFSLGTRGQDVTQRGQDIQYAESQAQLALTKSLQEAAQRQQILQGIMGAISGPTLY
jgi:hypothetical protein